MSTPADPDAQARAAVRLLAQRMLYGARGMLFIAGSLLLVISAATFTVKTGLIGSQTGSPADTLHRWQERGLNGDDWLALGHVLAALVVLMCGWLVMKKPRLATVLPLLLVLAQVILAIVLRLSEGIESSFIVLALEVVLAGVLIRALREAWAFHREAQVARDHWRGVAISRMREQRERERAGPRPQ